MTAKCISLDFYHTLMDGCDFLFVLGILAPALSHAVFPGRQP